MAWLTQGFLGFSKCTWRRMCSTGQTTILNIILYTSDCCIKIFLATMHRKNIKIFIIKFESYFHVKFKGLPTSNFSAPVLGELPDVKYIMTYFLGCKCTRFGSTYTKIGTIQRRLAWPLRKDDTQIREAFHIFELQKNF